MSDLQSKLNRAIVALLIDGGGGSTGDTFAEFVSAEKAFPVTVVNCGSATEHVPYTGNWRFNGVTVNLRDAASNEPTETNQNASWRAALNRYNTIRDLLTRVGDAGEFNFMPQVITAAGRALAVSDLTDEGDQKAEDNADMVAFTVMWWNPVTLISPRLSPDGNCFESEIQFDCIACNGNIS